MKDANDVLSRYLSSKARRVSPNYLRDHGIVLRSIIRELSAGGTSVLECDLSALESWVEIKSLRVKRSTVAAYLFALELFLGWCEKENLVAGNVARQICIEDVRRPFRKAFGNLHMVKTLIDQCEDPALKFILFAGFHAGLRKNEIINCKRSWFNFEAHTINVLRCETFDTKDGEDRTIPLTKDFEAYLCAYQPMGDYMLPNWHSMPGGRYRYDFRKKYRNYMDRQALVYGFPRLTIHDMRRTFASILVSSRKCTIYEVARWLGDDVKVVERHYGFLQPHDGAISLVFA